MMASSLRWARTVTTQEIDGQQKERNFFRQKRETVKAPGE